MKVEREYKVAVLKHCSFGVNAQKRRATRREGGERAATATKETSRLISSPRFNYLATWVTPTPGHVSMISCKVYGSGRSVDKFTGASSEGGDSAGKRVREGIIESRRKIDSETGCWSSLQMLARTGPCLHFADSSRPLALHLLASIESSIKNGSAPFYRPPRYTTRGVMIILRFTDEQTNVSC